MKKRKAFIFFILIQFIFFFLPPGAMTSDDNDIFENTNQLERIEELSSKAKPPLPSASPQYAPEVAEAVYLIKELEREIFLTNLLIELREKGYTKDEIDLALEKEREKWMAEEVEVPSAEIPEEIAKEGVSEEAVIAKVISVESTKSLPSLITELEKKRKGEKVESGPAAPVEEELYFKKELEKDKLSVIIEKEQTILIPAAGLERFMVTDPEVIKATRIDDKISVTGTAVGGAFLHIWDGEGRRSIRVGVRYKGYSEYLRVQKQAIKAKEMSPFKVGYAFDRYRINSESVQAARSYHHTLWAHNLNISGETPWGRTIAKMRYEGQEIGGGAKLKHDLVAWTYELTGDDLDISLGNTGAYFSDLTLPASGFQGIRFGNPRQKDLHYELIWGARGSRMWGYRVSTWTNANYFCGARTEIKPADFIHFNTTYMRSLEDAEDVGEYVYAAGTGLKFLNDAIRIEAEAARNKSEETDQHTHGYIVNTTVDLKDYNLLLKCKYVDIGPNFLSVTGGGVLPYVGEMGYYFNGSYNPLKYLRLTGEYKIYRERINFNPADPQEYNRDWRSAVNFRMGRDTNFNFAAWRRNHEGERPPTHSGGESYQISHSLKLPLLMRNMNISLSYTPSRHRNLSSHSSDYREKRYRGGMRLNVLKNLYYELGYAWHDKHKLESGEKGTLKTLITGLNYSSRIFNTPFYGSLGLRYRKERDVMENLPLSSGENVISGDAGIRYSPSPDFETHLKVNYDHIRGVLDHSLNRQEMRIWAGGGYLFNTTLRWGTGGSVKGYVFKDWNLNGIKDPYEEGLAGIRVYAGEYRSEITVADGSFEFRRLKEKKALVLYDVKMVPEGYKPTTASGQTVKLERGFVSEVNFGIVAVGDISGTVFNDVNMNGVFDEGDEGVTGVLLRMDDGTMAQTGARGYYRMEDVKVMPQTLTLDRVSLPFNLLPLTEAKRTIDVEAGKFYEEHFALYALRTVVGNVFIDKNGNKKLDSGEEGAADVVLRCGDAAAITDNSGRYFLKNLAGGAQNIILDTETIPSGYRLSVEPSVTVVLAPEGEIREDVNFALEKK